MFESSTTGHSPTTTPDAVLAVVAGVRAAARVERMAQARVYALVVEFALRHARLSDGAVGTIPASGVGTVLPGTERRLQLAGDGTPTVAEFAHLELAVGLGIPEEEAAGLLIGALALKYRMPKTWDLVMAGHLERWRADKLVRAIEGLPLEAAHQIDDEVAALAGTMPFGRLLRTVEGRALELLPTAEADKRRRDALESRGVWVEQSDNGIAGVNGHVDAADGIFLDAQLSRLARILADGGSEEPLDVRRAKALGVLATPARALQLLQASLLDQLPDLDPECPAQGQRGHTCGTIQVDPDKLLPRAQVYVHLTDQTLRDKDGLARAEGMKPILAGWLGELLGHCRIRVTPVLQADGIAPVDSYEIPERMREAVTLRNQYSVFPWATRRSRKLDLDHTRAFDHGLPPLDHTNTRPDPARQPRTTHPHPTPSQDPRRLASQPDTTRPVRVDHTPRATSPGHPVRHASADTIAKVTPEAPSPSTRSLRSLAQGTGTAG